MVIKQFTFLHSRIPYSYTMHNVKISGLLDNFLSLKNYLSNLISTCPNSYFENKNRSSTLKFKLNAKLENDYENEMCLLARYGLDINKDRFSSNHMKVQMFALENDKKTIAIEVPIWLEQSELKDLNGILRQNEPFTGHIDILRLENGKIWIWDYKPEANKEEFAATQTYFYALMLSKRINLSLDNFMCGYFDKDVAYVFNPYKCVLDKNLIIKKFVA